jgi:hypothetical protein
MLVCLAMFALGGAVLWGLFQAPRGRSPASPDLPWGVPVNPVGFVSLDFGGQPGVAPSLVKQVRDLDPDFVLVQNIRFDDVLPLAEALGMERSYHPQLFQRPDPRSQDAAGDVLFSKHPLYDATPIVLDPAAQQPDGRGVRAVAVVGGVRFVVATGVGATDDSRRAFEASWKQAGSPPTVLATGFLRPRRGAGAYSGEFWPAVILRQEAEQGGAIIPVAGLYADPSWALAAAPKWLPPTAGGAMVLYARLNASPPAATQPRR